jgi:hypothetical protein
MLLHPCKFGKAIAIWTLGIATAIPMAAPLAPSLGQAATTAPVSPARSGAGRLAFDAASVRPSNQEFALKGVEFLNPASDLAPPPGGLLSWNVQLPWLINFAYNLRSSQTRREARKDH